jgi:hypothetical protein
MMSTLTGQAEVPSPSYVATYTGPVIGDPEIATATTDHGGMPSPVHGGIKREPGTPGESQLS